MKQNSLVFLFLNDVRVTHLYEKAYLSFEIEFGTTRSRTPVEPSQIESEKKSRRQKIGTATQENFSDLFVFGVDFTSHITLISYKRLQITCSITTNINLGNKWKCGNFTFYLWNATCNVAQQKNDEKKTRHTWSTFAHNQCKRSRVYDQKKITNVFGTLPTRLPLYGFCFDSCTLHDCMNHVRPVKQTKTASVRMWNDNVSVHDLFEMYFDCLWRWLSPNWLFIYFGNSIYSI